MKLPLCLYPSDAPPPAGCGGCAQPIKKNFNMLWSALNGNLDMDNWDSSAFGDGLSVVNKGVDANTQKRKLINVLADPNQQSYIDQKAGNLGTSGGINLVAPSSGSICVTNKDDPTNQVISLIPQSTKTAAAAYGRIRSNLGIMYFGTKANYDIIFERNAAEVGRWTASGFLVGKVTLADGAAATRTATFPDKTGTVGILPIDLSSGVTGSLPWASVSKTGSSLADLVTRSAGDLSSGTLLEARLPAFTGGDATTSAGSGVISLNTVNGNVGTFGGAGKYLQLTVNGLGLVTAASQGTQSGLNRSSLVDWLPRMHIDLAQIRPPSSSGGSTFTVKACRVRDRTDTVDMSMTSDQTVTLDLTLTSPTINKVDTSNTGLTATCTAGTKSTITSFATIANFNAGYISRGLISGSLVTGGGSSTTVTGSGTVFTQDLKPNDLIGTTLDGYRRVITVTDDTHVTVSSAISITQVLGVIIEQPTMRVGSEANNANQIDSVSAATPPVITPVNNWGTTHASAATLYIGVPVPSTTCYVWLGGPNANPSTCLPFVSVRYSTPFGLIANYSSYYRLLGTIDVASDGTVAAATGDLFDTIPVVASNSLLAPSLTTPIVQKTLTRMFDDVTGNKSGGTMYYRDSNKLQGVSIGSTGNVLNVSGGAPAWSSLTALFDAIFANVDGDLIQRASGTWQGKTLSQVIDSIAGTNGMLLSRVAGAWGGLAIGAANSVAYSNGSNLAYVPAPILLAHGSSSSASSVTATGLSADTNYGFIVWGQVKCGASQNVVITPQNSSGTALSALSFIGTDLSASSATAISGSTWNMGRSNASSQDVSFLAFLPGMSTNASVTQRYGWALGEFNAAGPQLVGLTCTDVSTVIDQIKISVSSSTYTYLRYAIWGFPSSI